MHLTSFIRWSYRHVLKPVFFKVDPEVVHDRMVGFGAWLGSFAATRRITSWFFEYKDPALEQDILGIHFPNPVGLAAGFDKKAKLAGYMADVGFGFAEVGSITAQPSKGNPGKRLWRLPKSNGLVVNYGLPNEGAKVVRDRLVTQRFRIPIGVSMAKTNCAECAIDEKAIEDHIDSLKVCLDVGDYYTINVSCPNAFGGQPFHRPEALDRLLAALDHIPTPKPIFLKLSPDGTTADLDEIVAVADRHRVHGFILSNLTKRYELSSINKEEMAEQNIITGGISGKPVEDLSNVLIRHLYQTTHGKYLIIGCGGIFTAEDAYAKIKYGASLVQLITGMIFEGPQLIGEINRGLVELLKKDGYKNVSEAVGGLVSSL